MADSLSSKIRVLYFMDGYGNGGGIQEQCVRWIANINHGEYQVDVLAYNRTNGVRDDYADRLKALGCELFLIAPYADGGSVSRSVRETKLFFETHKYDVLHAHSSAKAIFVLREARRNGVPVRILHSHAARVVTEQPFKKFMANVLKGAAKRESTNLAACSTEAGEFLFGKECVASGEVTIIPNAIELERFSYNSSVREQARAELGVGDDIVIGHVGRFMPQKNHSFLIDVMAAVLKRHHNARLVLVGVGQLQGEIREKVNSLGIEGQVMFLGLRSDVDRLVQAMDVFVMPSLFEGLPVSVVEAQASGLPCVLSEEITPEAVLIPGSMRVSLSCTPEEWAEKILSVKGCDRSLAYGVVSDKGFEIAEATRRLEAFYMDALRSAGVEK